MTTSGSSRRRTDARSASTGGDSVVVRFPWPPLAGQDAGTFGRTVTDSIVEESVEPTMVDEPRRRGYLSAVVGLLTGLAGCAGIGATDTDGPPGTDSRPTESPTSTRTDEPPADGMPTDEPPADGPPTDEPPADGPPTDEPTADGTPTVEQTPSFDIDATLPDDPVTAGEELTVSVSVTNAGTTASTDFTMAVDGTTATTETVEIPAGETVTVELTTDETHFLGPVDVAVGGERVGTVTFVSPSTIHVAPDGRDYQPGTEAAPLGSIQEGVERARPGDTVSVHPGEYEGPVLTRRSGEPDAPVEITGPPDAILRANPDDWRGVVEIRHSHVHLTGLTVTGLFDPDAPDDPESYADKALVGVSPLGTSGDEEVSDEYLTDVKVMPDRIGNAGRNMVIVWRTETIEIGEFEVIGPAGASWVYSDERSHIGEIVYLGQAPDNVVADHEWYPWDEYDLTSDVHVHHVDNSAGHPHSELVDCKMGTHDVTIEYCTDAGGSQNDESWTPTSVALGGHDATVRWCRLANGDGNAIDISDRRVYSNEELSSGPASAFERAGKGNAIYGNEVAGFDKEAITLTEWLDAEPFEQEHVCGNDVEGETDFSPGESCPASVPDGDGVGHLGGDSPWSE